MATTEEVYGAFVDYYGDIKMKMIKNEHGWAVYAAKAHSGLNQNRYLFAIVPNRMVRNEEALLNELDWISFQTRSSDEVYAVPTHHLYLDEKRKQLFSDKIKVVERTRDETFYVTDTLPIKIKLLHDPKKKNYLQYPDQAFMYQALDTFRCVVELL